MAMKTIITTVALHVPGENHKPFEYEGGSRISGVYDAEMIPPGKPATLDEKEADRILARFGGREVTADGDKVVEPAVIVPPKLTTEPAKPVSSKT